MKLLKHILLALSLAFLTPATWAQTIPNPSFESNTFTVYPGYVSDNGAITGWTASPANRVGLNPSSGSPFADNGAIPQGANVAFVQSIGSGSTLSTAITGLTSGAPYRVSFRANSRSIVVAPNPSWSLNGGAFVPFTASPAVGSSNPYYTNSGVFIATGTTASLVISNQTAGDSAVLVDDFSIAPVPVGTWSVNAWTGDASSGIVPGQTLWAYHFGNTNSATVNGITVPGTGTNENPLVAGQFKIGGLSFVFPNHANNLTTLGGNGSAVMAKSFIYGGAPRLITVEGLTAGQVYTVSIYGVGFNAPDTRTSIFTSYADSLSVDENSFGTGNGMRVDYTFTALATTNLITVTPTNANTFHTYGLALRQPLLVTTTSNSGPGSLRQAVLDAATIPGADPITFVPALSGTTITLTNEIVLGSDVTIDATSLPGGVTVSGGNVTRIFFVNSGQTVLLRGLTLTGGNGVGATYSGDGGAIENNEGTLALMQCTLFGNTGRVGGAIDHYDGVLTVTNCTLSGNSANLGGAIFSDADPENGSKTTVVNSTIAGNIAKTQGGGVHNDFGLVEIIQCTISGNIALATNRGGAGIFSRGRVALLNCCVVSNEVFTSPISPSFGGGIACDVSGDVRLTNCTVAFNQLFGSQSPGAAFYNLGTFVMDHCTIVNNLSASGTNGGVAAGGTTSLHATVLANGGKDFINAVGGSSLGNNLISDGSGSGLTNGINGDQIGTSGSPLNPLLASFGNYGGPTQTLPPLPGSPAINAASATDFGTDQRGYPRPVGLAADIGAVEGIYNAVGPGSITSITRLANGFVRLSFTNLTDASFPVVATTNLSQSLSNWTQIGFATETSAGTGLIQFTDSQAPFNPQRFYRVKSP